MPLLNATLFINVIFYLTKFHENKFNGTGVTARTIFHIIIIMTGDNFKKKRVGCIRVTSLPRDTPTQ